MATWRDIMDASRVAFKAFQVALAEPYAQHTEFATPSSFYHLLWEYYRNEAYSDIEVWSTYLQSRGMYKATVNIYNPVRRLVDFYSGIVYSGTITHDGGPLDDGHPSAIPFDIDTPPEILAAASQIFQWSNWQTENHVMVRFGACVGSVLVEILDDVEKGRVRWNVVWPGFVDELELDDYGNLKMYSLEYEAFDYDTGTNYTYRREVNKKSISTFKDNSPFGYGNHPAVYEHPYGFVPAVWIRHTNSGTDIGYPALRSISKIDHLNSLASHAVDQMHKISGAPVVVSGDSVGRLSDSIGPTVPAINQKDTIEIIRGAAGTTVQTLSLPAGETMAHIERMISEIEKDHPELTLYEQMRGMSQITGPAAERLFGDVASYVNEARAAYDMGTVKLVQMGLAVGGYRANGGGWKKMTHQQQKFTPFNIDSYEDGDLPLSILPRPLVPVSESEIIQLQRDRIALENERMGGEAVAGVQERIRTLATNTGGAGAKPAKPAETAERVKRPQSSWGTQTPK